MRFLPTTSDSVKEIIILEGRPVRLVKDTRGKGSALNWSASNLDWTFPEGTSQQAGTIDSSPGRAIYIQSITVTCDQPGLVEGFLARNTNAPWLGGNDPNVGGAIDNAFSIVIGEGGGGQTIPVEVLYGEFFWLNATYRPMRKGPTASYTGNSGLELVDPNIAITVTGYEITNDFNFRARKRLLFAGDSLSWSLVGDWRTHDQINNLSLSREAGGPYPFPPNFGDTLASFRLIKKMRSSGQDIRLINKGFGGSKLHQEQWYALKNQLYTLPWNIFILQAGANDAGEVQTPLLQLTFKERMRDFVKQRNDDGRSKYPMVFCNCPSLDDKSSGLNSRNNLDVRVPIDGESYDYEFNSGDNTTIDFSQKSEKYYFKVSGNGSNTMTLSGGTQFEVYRVDFWDDTELFTGTANATYSYVKLIDANPPSNGKITINAGTVIFFECVNNDVNKLEYHEIERCNLIGKSIPSDQSFFDPGSPSNRISHFITSVNTTRTMITGATNSLSQKATISSVSLSPGEVELNLTNSEISNIDWPSAAQINTNDVWVRVSGMSQSVGSATYSWGSVNGFYRVTNYVGTSNVTSINIPFDARDGDGRDFSGTYVNESGTVEVIKSRSYIAMFEGNQNSTQSNCSYFQNGTYSVDDYDFVIKLKPTTGTSFDLIQGKGIAFSYYQQGNLIFMNEIVSGDIVNSGVIYGTSSVANFYSSSNEYGKTRTQIVNTNIASVCAEYTNDNVHLIQLNDASDIMGVSETDGGRLQYLKTSIKSLNKSTETKWQIGDLIDDPAFKKVGDSGINECVVGSRVHRSPRGHELMYERMWSVVQNINIPN